MPQEIDEVERRVMQLEIERTALQKEKDPASMERRKTIERELAELKERSSAMKAQWQQEKDTLGAPNSPPCPASSITSPPKAISSPVSARRTSTMPPANSRACSGRTETSRRT